MPRGQGGGAGKTPKERLLQAMDRPSKRRNNALRDEHGHAPPGTGKRSAAAKVQASPLSMRCLSCWPKPVRRETDALLAALWIETDVTAM